MNGAHILVVEDDRVVARHLEQQLQRLGYRVVGKTASGEEACDLAAEGTSPPSDLNGDADYRNHLAGVLTLAGQRLYLLQQLAA